MIVLVGRGQLQAVQAQHQVDTAGMVMQLVVQEVVLQTLNCTVVLVMLVISLYYHW